MDTDRCNLITININSCLSLDTFSFNIKLFKTIDNGFFQLHVNTTCNKYKSHISMQIFKVIVKIEDGISCKLSRSVMSNLCITIIYTSHTSPPLSILYNLRDGSCWSKRILLSSPPLPSVYLNNYNITQNTYTGGCSTKINSSHKFVLNRFFCTCFCQFQTFSYSTRPSRCKRTGLGAPMRF